jgi:chromosome partitioning protein
MTIRIAVAQRKGGVGKTTIAVSLAAEFSRRRANVILIDADPLRSACEWGGLGRLKFKIEEITFAPQQSVSQWASSVTRVAGDYILIDTPPSDRALAASLAVADLVLIPCMPSGLDLDATARTMDIVKAVRARRSERLRVILVPNRVDWRTLEGKQIAEEMEQFDEMVAQPIGNRSAFVRSFAAGNSVMEFEPNGAAARELRELGDLVEQCLRKA